MINNNVDSICRKLDSMTDQLRSNTEQLRKLDLMESRLSNLESTTVNIKSDMEGMKKGMGEMEKSMNFMNKQFEKNQEEISELRKYVDVTSSDTTKLKESGNLLLGEISDIKNELEDLKERHIDLQSRSMRDNLVFTGIVEPQREVDMNTGRPIAEDTESILRDFLDARMDVRDIAFHRVHRMGKPIAGKARPIVAKFVLFKDREKVRKLAKEKLSGTAFGINEQYPREINERRKALYPTFKRAKQQGKRANFVLDKLFVDGVMIEAPPSEPGIRSTSQIETTEQRSSNPGAGTGVDGYRGQSNRVNTRGRGQLASRPRGRGAGPRRH